MEDKTKDELVQEVKELKDIIKTEISRRKEKEDEPGFLTILALGICAGFSDGRYD